MANEPLDTDLMEHLRGARRPVVLTGAGMSAESGVPTFREAQSGLWARFDPVELATPEAFERHPQRVLDWYAWRREQVAKARPHAGHQALARWEAACAALVIVTQNVDGLHQRAGSRNVVELHGRIDRDRCHHCGERAETPARVCAQCGGPLRPDVVWFGEMLPEPALRRALGAVSEADLVLSVGTSTLVQPAASLPAEALAAGVPVVEINPEPTSLKGRTLYRLRGKAAEWLPRLVAIACD
ncbi:SIR2 family NAD-dependent protein deacylase [Alkalilimnicola ehrlichii]|uniref:SIR2 family NAD-dependent protein deacylase n=1 Tax=Alkalilimnicola ehrlichii TaxID=351052 RepID=UPI003B9DE908